MNAETVVRVAIGIAACVSLAWPFLRPRLDSFLQLATLPKLSSGSIESDAHTVMTIALRLKAAGKTKSSEIARSLIDSILTE